jgi:hypothetical protein
MDGCSISAAVLVSSWKRSLNTELMLLASIDRHRCFDKRERER